MLKQEWEIDNPLYDQLEDQMEVLNEYSEIMKKSVGQYAELTKKMQETATAALEQQLAATKEYMEWSMKTNSKLMEDFVNFSTTARSHSAMGTSPWSISVLSVLSKISLRKFISFCQLTHPMLEQHYQADALEQYCD
jgi:hypothetical protein